MYKNVTLLLSFLAAVFHNKAAALVRFTDLVLIDDCCLIITCFTTSANLLGPSTTSGVLVVETESLILPITDVKQL